MEQTESELKNVQASSPSAAALREVIAAVKHQTVSPLPAPTTASGWLARSYYYQSRGQLTEALHAARLAFRHPHDNRVLEFEAPLPADMLALLTRLRG